MNGGCRTAACMWTVWWACRWVRMVEVVAGVWVFYEWANVTHEASIGSVDKKLVETLRYCGLDESEAVDVIVRGTRNIFIGVRLKNALYRPRYISYGIYRDQHALKHKR